MSSRADTQGSSLDSVKLVASLLVIGAAVAAFYWFADQSLLLRVLGLLAALVVAAVIALQTERGRAVAEFVRATNIEVRKVVWPSRKETMQTTLVIIITVIVVALFLWGIDAVIAWAIKTLMGREV
ncbi:MAG: preprotein translocase subunit SecE [Gammaproteobacteria bacterium]|nr:MAG: preprotein translocase subunit SecE [Gammaproteobacteria bacterium]